MVLMRQAAVPGLDLWGGFRLLLTADTSKWTERGREAILTQVTDIIHARLNAIGIIEPAIQRQGEHEIVVEVPVSADTALTQWLVSRTGLLTFHLLKSGTEVQALRQRIDAVLRARAAADSNQATIPTTVPAPFSGLLASLAIENGVEDIVVAETVVPQVRAILADSVVQQEIQAFNRSHPPAGEFVWANEPVVRAGQRFYPLFFVKKEPDLIGTPLALAQASQAPAVIAERAPYAVQVTLNDEGRRALTSLSSANVGNRLTILIDREVCMTLVIQGRIPDGRAVIPGGQTIEEAQALATILRSGVFPVAVTTVETGLIGPTIPEGATAVRRGVSAGLSALVLVSVFLIIVYRVTGAIAVLGLLFDLVMTGAFLRLWKIAGVFPTLTLSGLVGFGFSAGLMIGSQILIFERIRDELAAPKGPKAAVTTGFASVGRLLLWLHAIILVIAFLLFQVSAGPVRDGALVLFAGTAASLLTLFLATRTIVSAVTDAWSLARLSI